MSETARERAEQSVSARFTRVMNATTSRLGMFTDPSIVGLATAPVIIALLAAMRLEAAPNTILALQILAVTPLTIAVLLALSMMGARGKVIDWLAGVPFPVENMNAVLNGLGESLEITFRDAPPAAKELNLALDKISAECFVTKGGGLDGAASGPKPRAGEAGGLDGAASTPQPDDGLDRVVEVRIGIVDSTRNPSVTNHQRFERVRAIVGDVLVPLSSGSPITEVRVK